MKMSKKESAYEYYKRVRQMAESEDLNEKGNKKQQQTKKRQLASPNQEKIPEIKKSKCIKDENHGTKEKKDVTETKKSEVVIDQNEEKKLTKAQRKRLRRKLKKLEKKQSNDGQCTSSAATLEIKEVAPKKVKKLETSHELELPPDSVTDESEEMSEDEATLDSEDADVEPMNPYEEGSGLFQEIIHPTSIEDFFQHYWEKKILHVKRKSPNYYQKWLSTEEMDEMLRENRVMFSEHLDVTSYEDGVRSTLNPDGRAFAAVVWDFFRSGCSVRMLCPQAFSDQLAFNLNLLQEYFGCFVGANTYLTPPGTQGFAPHYDDIEAFILQLEGKKMWRIYKPRNSSEKLPRFSSGNFKPNEVGNVVMQVTLHAGDMLYLPRGMIHQALCPDDEYSFHLTVSTNQKNTWGDLLQKLMPMAVEKAMAENVLFRKGLPPGFLRYMGTCVPAKQEKKSDREKMIASIKSLVSILSEKYLPIDSACDEIGKQLTNDSLPPILEDNEAQHHVSQQGERWSEMAPGVINVVEISPDTELRLVRYYAVRCVQNEQAKSSQEGDEDQKEVADLYHSLCNTRIYREVEPIFSSVSAEALPCIKQLMKAFPSFVRVEDLAVEGLNEKLSVAASLYDMGLVVSKKNLSTFEDDPETDSDSDSDSDMLQTRSESDSW